MHCTAAATLPPHCPLAAVCSKFVGCGAANCSVVGAAYELLKQATSALCLGSSRRLEAATAASSDGQKCTAVVWALQVRGRGGRRRRS